MEYLPNPGWGTAVACWALNANPPLGPTNPQLFPNVQLGQQASFIKGGQLYPYLKSEKPLLCPIDRPDPLYYQRAILHTSYVWNGAVNGYGAMPNNKTYKITRFRPQSILQWETDERTPFYFNDCSSYPDEGISLRHGKGATFGLFSGGTERILYREWYTRKYAGASGLRGAGIPAALLPNQLWCNPARPNGLP
jgi:hypothetical protein